MISKGRVDEVFVIREHSILIKIADLIDAINQGTVEYSLGRFSVAELTSFIGADRARDEVLKALPASRRDEPLVVSLINGEARVIDGNHRLAKRDRDGFGFCEVLELRAESLEHFVEPLGF